MHYGGHGGAPSFMHLAMYFTDMDESLGPTQAITASHRNSHLNPQHHPAESFLPRAQDVVGASSNDRALTPSAQLS